MTKVGVCGCAGRMGKTIIQTIAETEGLELGAAIEHSGSDVLGQDAGLIAGLPANNVIISSSIADCSADFDVLIDFTLADATINNVQQCREAGKRMVIGTTGMSEEQKSVIQDASKDIAIVFAPNMSIGVNLMFKLTELAAEIIGDSTDIEIIEAHHSQKQDAPSGTAVRLGEIIADKLGRDLKDCAVYGREGHTGERDTKTIGFETIRAGDIVGEHTAMFASSGERVEIKHVATSRRTFSNGAVRAARWIMQQDKGLFDMQDVLGLR